MRHVFLGVKKIWAHFLTSTWCELANYLARLIGRLYHRLRENAQKASRTRDLDARLPEQSSSGNRKAYESGGGRTSNGCGPVERRASSSRREAMWSASRTASS